MKLVILSFTIAGGYPKQTYHTDSSLQPLPITVQPHPTTQSPGPAQHMEVIDQGRPPNCYLGLAIFVTIFCCLLLGIGAIVSARKFA